MTFDFTEPSQDARAEIDPEDARLLSTLATLWDATRAPEVAEVIELLAGTMPAVPVGGRTKAEREARWLQVARRRDPTTLGSLLACEWPSNPRSACERLDVLRTWPDPRISAALAEVLTALPYASASSITFYEFALRELAAMRDPRTAGALQEAGAALMQRFPAQAWLSAFRAAADGSALRDALRSKPPKPLHLGEPVLVRARQRVAGLKEGSEARAQAEKDFLDRICDQPDSEELRRVFADWLQERGDPRGEFIALQCEHAAGRGTEESRRREKKLRDEHRDRLLGRLAPFVRPEGCSFERGFLERAATDTALLARGLGERAWATVRTLVLPEAGDPEVLARFLAGEGRRVRALHGVRVTLARELTTAMGQACPLEDLGVRLWSDETAALELPRLRRLGVIRERSQLGMRGPGGTRALKIDEVVPGELWRRLTGFATNDVPAAIPEWFARFQRMDWLTCLRVLSDVAESALDPEGFEIRFERDGEGRAPRLVVEAHQGARSVGLAATIEPALRALPLDLRQGMVVAGSDELTDEQRAALDDLRAR